MVGKALARMLWHRKKLTNATLIEIGSWFGGVVMVEVVLRRSTKKWQNGKIYVSLGRRPLLARRSQNC